MKEAIELGSHTMFIAEIADVKADELIMGVDGGLEIEKLKGFFFLPGEGPSFIAGEIFWPISKS